MSVGLVPPVVGVAAENSAEQGLPTPLEFTHAAMMSASEFSSATGAVPLAGSRFPGTAPVVQFTSMLALLNAFTSPAGFTPDAPTCATSAMNGVSAYTAATVVNSFIEIKLELVSVLHGPIAAIRRIAVLFVPLLSPGLPPLATI
jgi:hypothetical protein